jgi:hypothetical protein
MEILKRIGSKSEFRTLTGSFLEFSHNFLGKLHFYPSNRRKLQKYLNFSLNCKNTPAGSALILHDPGVFLQCWKKVGYFCNFRLFEG